MSVTFKPSRYNYWHRGENAVYLYNVFTTGLLSLDEQYVDRVEKILQQPTEIETFTDEERRLLVDNGFLVPEGVDEIDMVKFRYRKSAFDNSHLIITMIPTKACNLACSYCFEHKKSAPKMSEEDCRQVLKFLEKELAGIRPPAFMIYWYGGEPLLAIDVIETISKGVAEICEKLGVQRVSDTMVTNGYLLDEPTAQKLKQSGIDNLQISLDGNREDHNRLRVLPNGGETFDRLRQSIDIARGHFSELTVRLNTNKGNLPGIREMLQTDPVFKEKNVTVSVGPLKMYLGGAVSREEDVDCFIGPELQRAQHEINTMLGKIPDEDSASGPFQFIIKGNNCGADQYKAFVIGPGALVYKCYERVDPGEEVGIIKEGKFIPSQNYWGWAINEPFKYPSCRDCLYLPICMGGCPSMRKRLGLPNTESCGFWDGWLKIKLEQIDRGNDGKI
jgi:uncharacterized protein